MPTKAQTIYLLLCVSLAFNALSYMQHVAHADTRDISDTPPEKRGYVRVNDDCDMKYGPEHVTEGVIRYLHEITEMAIEDIEQPITYESTHVDQYNDFLCWTPYVFQPVLIGLSDDIMYLAIETAPAVAERAAIKPSIRKEMRP